MVDVVVLGWSMGIWKKKAIQAHRLNLTKEMVIIPGKKWSFD